MDNRKEGQSGSELVGTISKRVINNISKMPYLDHDAISTGYKNLDDLTGKLHMGELVVIGARPAMGKTALALNMVNRQAIEGGIRIAYFSSELTKEGLVSRLLQINSQVDSVHVRVEKITDDELDKLIESADKIGNSVIVVNDDIAPTVTEIYAECKRLKQEYDIQEVFVDYVQLLRGPSDQYELRKEETEDVIHELKRIATELNICIVALSQVGRTAETRADHRARVTDFIGSDAYETYVDTLMFIYRDDYYNKDSEMKGIAEIQVNKGNNKKAGVAKMSWFPEMQTFL